MAPSNVSPPPDLTKPVTITNIYLMGAFRCFPALPQVPPEVLMAAVRLLACIDDDGVLLSLDGPRALLTIAGHLLAELSEQVKGHSTRVVIASTSGSPNEDIITKEHVKSTIIEPIRLYIASASND